MPIVETTDEKCKRVAHACMRYQGAPVVIIWYADAGLDIPYSTHDRESYPHTLSLFHQKERLKAEYDRLSSITEYRRKLSTPTFIIAENKPSHFAPAMASQREQMNSQH